MLRLAVLVSDAVAEHDGDIVLAREQFPDGRAAYVLACREGAFLQDVFGVAPAVGIDEERDFSRFERRRLDDKLLRSLEERRKHPCTIDPERTGFERRLLHVADRIDRQRLVDGVLRIFARRKWHGRDRVIDDSDADERT